MKDKKTTRSDKLIVILFESTQPAGVWRAGEDHEVGRVKLSTLVDAQVTQVRRLQEGSRRQQSL